MSDERTQALEAVAAAAKFYRQAYRSVEQGDRVYVTPQVAAERLFAKLDELDTVPT